MKYRIAFGNPDVLLSNDTMVRRPLEDVSVIGKKLGSYEIRSLIGSGGMAQVYRAYDAALDRDVAIKVLLGILALDEESVRRFYQEARAAANLSHPNVVVIHDIGEEDGSYYFVMEYLDGETVEERLDHERRLGVEESLGIALQVCRGVEASHRRGLLHRDIKAQNVMLMPDGSVKVLDFGIARASGESSLTRVGETLGTVGYMAPEQILGEEVDERSDIYSIGVLLYRMLTGSMPFVGTTPVSVVYQQLEEQPVAPGVVNPSVPMAVESIVLNALSREPEDRYGCVAEMLDAVERQAHRTERTEREEKEEGEPEERLGDRREFRSRLVGRDRELGKLKAAFDKAAEEKSGCTIFLAGEAGMGKTRLAEELMRYAQRHGGVTLTGMCLYGYREGAEPYLPFIEAIGRYFGVTRGQAEDERRDRIKRFIGEELPELRWLTEQLGTTIGFDRGTDSGSKGRLFEALSQLLIFLADEEPLVLFLDDVHWADTATLELLHYVARTTSSHPLMILASYRPEDLLPEGEEQVHPLTETMRRMSREGLYDQVEVEGVSAEDLGEMLRSIFRRVGFSAEFRSSLYRETGGNPFFVLEVLRLLKEQGEIFEQSGTWRNQRGITREDIPSRVYDVVIRRVSRLGEEERELLQTASVQGDRFDSEALSVLVGMDRMEVLRTLGRLERVHQVVRSEAEGYVFSHTKIREVLYDETAPELRRVYHVALADYLEDKQGTDSERIVSVLAHHFYSGEAYGRALPYLRRAGEKATGLFAYRQAGRYYTQGLEALEKAREIEDWEALQRDFLYLLGLAHKNLGEWKDALEILERSMSLAQDMGDTKAYAQAMEHMGAIQHQRGELESALEYYGQALEAVEQTGDLEGQCRVLNNTGIVYHERSEWDQVLSCYRRALEISREIEDQEQMADVLMNLGILFQMKGQLEEARTHYSQCIRTYRDLEDDRGLARVLHNVGMLYADLKEWDNAQRFYTRSLELAKKTRDLPLQASTYLNETEVFLGMSDLRDARRSCVRALEQYGKLDDRLGIADGCRMLGMIGVQEEDWEGAKTCFERSLVLNRSAQASLGAAETLREYGVMLWKKGEMEDALLRLSESRGVFLEIGAEEDIKQIDGVIADMRGDGGRLGS